jgi:methyl-accepting chemotaxis protein
MEEMIEGMKRNAKALGASSGVLSSIGEKMMKTAEETARQAGSASDASEEVSRNVQTLAAGTEEMSASIREIARNASDAARVAGSAVTVATSTNAMVVKLGESSAQIGKVIKVITSIAQQTNLLALNATIEAARAGQAGKGFAVVANEVKELAKETAKATDDITNKISAIQADTSDVVAAISQIGAIIAKVNDIQTTIAGAVEEQTATTNEMSRNVSAAARGAAAIVDNVASVAVTARDTSAGAARSLDASRELSQMAAELDRLISSS